MRTEFEEEEEEEMEKDDLDGSDDPDYDPEFLVDERLEDSEGDFGESEWDLKNLGLVTEVASKEKEKEETEEFRNEKYLEHFDILADEEERVACRLCDARILSNTKSLANHLKLQHGLMMKGEAIQPLFCDKVGCDQSIIFVTFEELATHNKLLHRAAKNYNNSKDGAGLVCFLCGVAVKNLNVHMKMVHTIKETIPCSYPGCGKLFSKNTIKKHMNCHLPGICPYPHCKKKFTSKNRLKCHVEIVHEAHLQKKFPCPHCPQIYKRTVDLRRHISEVHVLGKIFNCPEMGCNQVFRRQTTLDQHARLHLNIKPFQCLWCDFTGAQQNNIRSHASTTHKEEFQSAQNSGLRYWQKTDSPHPPHLPPPPQRAVSTNLPSIPV